MRYLHTMLRVRDLERALYFYCDILGLEIQERHNYPQGRFTLVFLRTPEIEGEASPSFLELTYNWDGDSGMMEPYTGRHFGHIAFEVDNIYLKTADLMKKGIIIHRPPRDGRMTFIRSPEGLSIELLQKGNPLPPELPWSTMPNQGTW